MRGFFITGTDTEIGKTLVTAGILRYLRRKGLNVQPFKPVQTGAEHTARGLEAPDVMVYNAATDLDITPADYPRHVPFLYEPACSPHLAGRLADHSPSIAAIQLAFDKLAKTNPGVVIAESAGGVLVPLNEHETTLDLMQTLALPVILVARRGLGTINHSLLSLNALRNAGLDVAGVVFNETEPVEPDFIREDNPQTVAAFAQVEILGVIDYLREFDPASDKTWEQFEACMPGLDTLRHRLTQP